MATNTETQVQQLYVGLLGRAADKAGLTYWANQITTGARTLDDVRAAFVTTTEYTTGFGALTARADLVTAIYTNLFERTPTAAEVAYWVADTRPANQLVSAFLTYASAADQAVITNKTFVAQTYTDTVGTSFNAAAAKAVIDPVDGTATSVNTALTAITNGTLAGSVPGVGLVNAVVVANAAIDAYAKTAATANPTFDTDKNGSVSAGEAATALSTATAARLAAVKAADSTITVETSTALITAQQSDAVTAAATAKTAALATLTGGTGTITGAAASTAIANYDAAVAAKAAVQLTPAQVQADTIAQATAAAGVSTSLTASTPATNYTTLQAKVTAANLTITTTAELYAALKADVSTVAGGVVTVGGTGTATAAEHAALVAEVLKIPTYGAQLVASAEKQLAATKASTAVITTTAEVVKIDSNGTGTVGSEGQNYVDAATTLANKNAALIVAKAGDTTVTAAKTVADQYTALTKAVNDAGTAITTFNNANSTKLALSALTANTDATAKQDVFYFPTKIAATNDFVVGGGSVAFGAGDSIVLGSGYTFNSGALSTGNATALEVFFVKGATGTQVVIETNAVGSATTVTDTAGTVTSSNDTAVINLVGVTADHLSFSNGVVSYV